MSSIRRTLGHFGSQVKKAFERLINPKKDVIDAQVPGVIGVQVSIAALRGFGWAETVKAVDGLESLLRKGQPVSPAQFQEAFVGLVDRLKLFQVPGIGGMGLSSDDRKAFEALLNGHAAHGLSANQLALLRRRKPDVARSRYQMMEFLDKVKETLVTHATNVSDDAKRALRKEAPPVVASRHKPHAGTWI